MFFKKCVLQICSKYTGKHPCRSLSSVKSQISPVNLLHICRKAVLTNTYGELLSLWGATCLPYFSIQICVKFELFSNIFLTSSMFSSDQVVLPLPEFSLFLFRLVPCGRYFVTFCWIVFLQGGA